MCVSVITATSGEKLLRSAARLSIAWGLTSDAALTRYSEGASSLEQFFVEVGEKVEESGTGVSMGVLFLRRST